MSPILQVRDLSKSFGSLKALERVNFAVQPGEMFGLLGPNGAGKTTLLSIAAGLLRPTFGSALVAGKRLRRDARSRQQLGIVPQEFALYGDLTGRENLTFFGQLYKVPKAELGRRVDGILRSVGLTERADDKAMNFSGGMKRRLNLGIALVHHPQLLLLDEPTTGVDPQSRRHIFDEVRRLNDKGVTIVYTSHYMEEVQALCRRIGIIDHGRLIACDTLPNLLQQLPGEIRFRVSELNAEMQQTINNWPATKLSKSPDELWTMECPEVKSALIELVRLLQAHDVELQHLETDEPNLERVFLHLTGRALRD